MRTSQRGGRGPAPPAPPPSAGPAPPPSLRAHRYLELDAYLRKLLQIPSVASNYRLSEFLGIAKQGERFVSLTEDEIEKHLTAISERD